MSTSHCRCYIVPPHILNHMANHADPRLRAAGLGTLMATHALRTQRNLLAAIGRGGLPTGQLRRTVYDAGQQPDLPGHLARGERDGATGDAEIDEAFGFAGDTYNFYKQIFGRNSVDNRGQRLNSTVRYREEPDEAFDNAFWNGEQMVYGSGDGVAFTRFTIDLDVIGHELTHGVTQNEAALVYHKEPGALNESMSDVFGSMVKQWKLGQTVAQADWLIGAQLLIEQGQALRSMKAPGTAYDNDSMGKDPQPDRMSKYLHLADSPRGDSGGVHINSGIPNRAFYLACVNLGAAHAWDKAGRVWYAALTSRLTATAHFRDAAAATITIANETLSAHDAAAVRAAWQEVEVLPRATQVAVSTPVFPPSPSGPGAMPGSGVPVASAAPASAAPAPAASPHTSS
jgi:Zn-dependent metalloprotease